jgi:hypothetical protein
MRQRLTGGPLPNLVDPAAYYTLICCLVKQRYAKAKKTLDDADAKLVEIEDKIKRNQSLLDDNLKPGAFEKDVEAALPNNIECEHYHHKEDNPDSDCS